MEGTDMNGMEWNGMEWTEDGMEWNGNGKPRNNILRFDEETLDFQISQTSFGI